MQLQVTTIFLRSRRPVLCLLKRPPKARNTGRNARIFFCLSFGVRASIHTLPTNRQISALFLSCFGICWGGTPLKVAAGHPRRLRDDFATICYGFGSPFGGHSGPVWSQAGTMPAKVATQTPKKGVWREVQNQGPKKVHFGTSREGVRSVHSLTIAPFSVFHPCPFWLHFGLHFGVILGAKFATILLFGRPGRQHGP